VAKHCRFLRRGVRALSLPTWRFIQARKREHSSPLAFGLTS
jgi:hypothetical protein